MYIFHAINKRKKKFVNENEKISTQDSQDNSRL